MLWIKRSILLLLYVLGSHGALCAEEARLLRYPDINANQLTFIYADKIWVSDAKGGTAHALTDAIDNPSRPKFSPDGKLIAYTAGVDGNYDIYVIPVAGGIPRRITYHPAREYVLGWHPSGQSILFTSTMASQRTVYKQLFTVPVSGGEPEKLPIPYGESASFSADGKKIIYSYYRDFQEESWKRYYGGRAPDLWSYDLGNGDSQRITNHPASDSVPMQIDGQYYFLSERAESGRDNIWRQDIGGGEAQQVTNFTETDVRRPASDGKNIVFEAAGRLHILDLATGKSAPVQIETATALPNLQPKRVNVADRITNAAIGGDKQIVIEARGDIIVYDTKTDIANNLMPSSASAERFPQLSGNGMAAYFSDKDGEYNLYLQDTKNNSSARKLTSYGPGLRFSPFWSPDGSKLAFIDHEQIIWLVDAKSGNRTRIDQGLWRFAWDLGDVRLSWSPDNRWLVYSRGLENRNDVIFVYDTATKQRHQLTSGAFSDFAPSFDPTGNYLLMLSHRNFDPTNGDFNIDATWTYTDSITVNILPLARNIAAPGKPDWQMPKAKTKIDIDFTDIEGRLTPLKVAPGVINSLAAVEGGFAILRQGKGDEKNKLERYQFGKDQPSELQAENGLQLSDARASLLLTRAGDKLSLIDLEGDSKPKMIKNDRLSAVVDQRAEYKQMFEDAWRYARDFYYDPGLHGVDWKAEHDRYGALVPYASVDNDMGYILSELMGELEGGHVYAMGGAPGARGDATNVGLLGIDFKKAGASYQIGKIYQTGNRRFEHRSPMDDSTLGVHEGTYILSVNGRPLASNTSPWEPFVGLNDQIVELSVADRADGSDARTIKVKTLKSERKLRELAWVEENRRKVDIASGGRIGYIYVPNTSAEGQNELMIQYRSQFNKDALIIDERFNTGGALGDRMVELLNRPPLVWFRARNSTSYSLPELAHRGPKALIINGWSYSGGDGFPLLFKTAKVGPLIGTRTWGGLIGPGMFMPLVNGGFVSTPPIRVAGNDGEWSEGNEGVAPNIEIDNDPGQLAKGIDQQLDRAVAEMMAALKDYQAVPAPEFQKAGEWNPSKRGVN